MKHDWDYYLCRLDQDLASIYLNLGLITAAPIGTHPHATVVSVPMLRPDGNGMSTDEEQDALIALEDDLNSQSGAARAIYVGRLTARGSRVFYFYSADPAVLSDTVSGVMVWHKAYRYTVSSHADPEWSLYSNFLSPSLDNHERMKERRLKNTPENGN